MAKKIFYIFFILFIQYQIFSQECSICNKKYSVEELKFDLNVLKQVLLDIHPSVGYYHNTGWYKNYFDTALVVENSLTEKEFRILIRKKLNVLQCGHTNILPSMAYKRYLNKKNFNVIPYFMMYSEPYLINIKGIEKQDSLFKFNDTVLQINHQDVKQYADIFKDFLYVDADAKTSQKEMIQKNFIFYYSSLFENDSVIITKLNKSEKKDIVIKRRKYKQLSNELWKMQTDTLMNKYGGKFYTGVYFDKKKNIFYIKIKAFSGISMQRFFRKTFKKLYRNKTDVLIMDLRNNPGGKISQCLNLLSYLLPNTDSLFYQSRIHHFEQKKYLSKKLEYRIIQLFMHISKKKMDSVYMEKIRKKNRYHFDGRVYVITNCNTFSAANLVSVYLSEKRPNTITVGTETSGVIWGSSAVSFLRLTLPNTKIKILIPTFRIYHNIKTADDKNKYISVKPDIPVYCSPSDFLHKKDKALEAIYYHLMNTK